MSAYVFHAKVGQVANEGTASSRECKAEAPESPLECAHGHDSEGLEDHGKGRLPARHTAVQKSDTRDNQEDETTHDDLVDIFPFQADILGVDVDFLRVAAIGDAGIKGRLCPQSVKGSGTAREWMMNVRGLVLTPWLQSQDFPGVGQCTVQGQRLE